MAKPATKRKPIATRTKKDGDPVIPTSLRKRIEGRSEQHPTLAERVAAAGVATEVAEAPPIAGRAAQPGYLLSGSSVAMIALICGVAGYVVGAVVQAVVFS